MTCFIKALDTLSDVQFMLALVLGVVLAALVIVVAL
jgi:hypothetical protein